MSKIGKASTLFLTLVIAISCLTLLTVKPANAQSLPTPSVPEFTVRLVNNSYSTQPTTTTTTDPYTGEERTIITPRHYVKDEYIEVQIENQEFTPYTINYNNIDYRTVNLYFDVISKGHFSEDWNVVDDRETQTENYTSQYTTIKLYTQQNIPSPAQLDFKARAIIGYLVHQFEPERPIPTWSFPLVNFAINGTASDWSSTQTITIPANSILTTQTPTSSPLNVSPTVPELPWLVIVPLLLCVFSVAVIVRHRKNTNNMHYNLSIALLNN